MIEQSFEPLLLAIDSKEWLDFIQSRPESTLFHHPAWLNLISKIYHFKVFAVVRRDLQGKITAGIPFMEIPGIFRKKWVSLPFSDHCAPLYQDSNALYELSLSLISLNRIHQIPRMELRWKYPDDPNLSSASNYVLSRLKLNQNQEDVARRIKNKYFRQIKVAQERGVTTKMGSGVSFLSEFYDLHVLTRRKFGVPVQPWSYFKLLDNQLVSKGFGFFINAYKDEACVASALFLYWNKTLIYKYATSNEIGRHSLSMDLILWKAICWGCENGMDVLDMGRTELAELGLRNFKSRWGSEELPLQYSYIPYQETKENHSPIIFIFSKVIHYSPSWVCRLSGELFYRYLA